MDRGLQNFAGKIIFDLSSSSIRKSNNLNNQVGGYRREMNNGKYSSNKVVETKLDPATQQYLGPPKVSLIFSLKSEIHALEKTTKQWILLTHCIFINKQLKMIQLCNND